MDVSVAVGVSLGVGVPVKVGVRDAISRVDVGIIV